MPGRGRPERLRAALQPGVFEGAFAAGVHYLDMAMHLSVPHPERPFSEVGVLLGEEQLACRTNWGRGQLALVGMGVEPGFSDVVARYAHDHLFSRIDEIGVRDGADLVIDGYDFAPTFSIWTTIEECLNPPIIYERDRGWFTTAPFSEPEVFAFPEGIGPLSCVNVEHEEVVLMPRWLDVGRVTFKYGLGQEFIDVLRTLHKLGLDGKEPVDVAARPCRRATSSPPCCPTRPHSARTCTARRAPARGCAALGPDGEERSIYLYHVVDNAWSMREFGHQAVVWQTAVMPAVAIEMLATGAWSGAGVLGPEAFSADPFLELLDEQGVEWEWDDWPAPAPLAAVR